MAFPATFRRMRQFSLDWSLRISDPDVLLRGHGAKTINATVFLALTLAMAIVIGLLSVYVYDQCKKTEELAKSEQRG